jgi:hypothetical protein
MGISWRIDVALLKINKKTSKRVLEPSRRLYLGIFW